MKSIICLVLGLVTLAVYLPSARHAFLDYDDQQYVTENARMLAGLTWRGLGWSFGFHASNWHPLTWWSHMLDCQLFGLNAAGHHMTNVIFHVANTVLLFLVLTRMTGALWRSACVAALFGWHPLHVESVAWVAERKDVLSAFFWMLTMMTYRRYAQSKVGEISESKVQSPKSKVWYGLALFFFALGLMSKPMVVTLPFVLLLLDYWPLNRLDATVGWRRGMTVVLEKVPFFCLSGAACFLTVAAQQAAYSMVSTAGLPVSERLAHALIAYAHYLTATFVPRHLAVAYPYERESNIVAILGSAMLLAVISGIVLFLRRRAPYLVTGWFWFLGILVPVIGLVQVGDQAWADRYTYLPLIGLFIASVWTAGDALQAISINGPRAKALLAGGLAFAVALTLLITTSKQLCYWKNTRTLFEHAAQVTEHNARAITVLGSLLARENKLDEAIDLYQQVLHFKPYDPETHFFLGNALEQKGKLDSAISEYDQALWFKPLQEKTHLALGVALAKQKHYEAAADHYRAALALNPESAIAQNNLARVLHSEGRLDEAIEHYETALKLDPNLGQAHNNLGVLLLQKGRLDEGAAQLREAVRLRPGDAESEYNLALALNQQHNWKESAEIFARLAPARPNDARLYYELGVALAHTGKTREAMSRYAHALLLQQDYADALDGLSWILATDPRPEFRNGTEAVTMAERACELSSRQDARKLITLSAAYAEAGRFSEAADTVKRAQSLSTVKEPNRPEVNLEAMRSAFEISKPWRQPQ